MSKKESTSKVILSLEDYRMLDAYKQMFEKNSFIILTGGDLCLSVTKDEVISEMERTIRRCNKEIFDLKQFKN
tara:strand:+ start:9295 stop:9513 length:219 start_codon:yes stop_codon:yes gene_type:complete